MKKFLILSVMALALAGCSQYSRTDRALGGAAIGAGTGALIGSLASGGKAGGTLAGAAIGAVGGAIIGAETTPKACWARDRYGRKYRVQCP